MTQLTDQERTAQMNDMRSFDEQCLAYRIYSSIISSTVEIPPFLSLRLDAGFFADLFLGGCHMPSPAVDEPGAVKMVVV